LDVSDGYPMKGLEIGRVTLRAAGTSALSHVTSGNFSKYSVVVLPGSTRVEAVSRDLATGHDEVAGGARQCARWKLGSLRPYARIGVGHRRTCHFTRWVYDGRSQRRRIWRRRRWTWIGRRLDHHACALSTRVFEYLRALLPATSGSERTHNISSNVRIQAPVPLSISLELVRPRQRTFSLPNPSHLSRQ
jgi:hypothetical protein